MTPQEALHICKLAMVCALNEKSEVTQSMHDFIDAAKQKYDIEEMMYCIQKQIPKKLIYEREQSSPFGEDDYAYCPCCKNPLPYGVNYCEVCGQRLLWEDENATD